MATQHTNQQALWEALQPLQSILTFLNTGAHPDDERSDLLSFLAKGIGVDTSAIIANRGEGGQNEIGDESGNALGILRTKEMAAAAASLSIHAVHLSETTNDPIYDYGIEKTAEDTLRKWGAVRTYERLVRSIRKLKPDIVMPSFRDNNKEHGHHRAITALTLQAFRDAANPEKFPEHLAMGISPWQIKKLYVPAEDSGKETCSLEIGLHSPIHGQTYPQLGEQSRLAHRTQGMGKRIIPSSPRAFPLELIDSIVSSKQTDSFFAGIAFSFRDYAAAVKDPNINAKLHQLQNKLDAVITAFPDREAILALTGEALAAVDELIVITAKTSLETSQKEELLYKLKRKTVQLQKAGFAAASLSLETVVAYPVLSRGRDTRLRLKLTNNGSATIPEFDINLRLPAGWQAAKQSWKQNLKPQETALFDFVISVPEDADYVNPYQPAAVQAFIQLQAASAVLEQHLPLEELVVLPDVSVTCSPESIVINTQGKRSVIPVKVQVKRYRPEKLTASINLKLPKGWTLITGHQETVLDRHLGEKEAEFLILPPKEVEHGEFSIQAEAVIGESILTEHIQEISYNHIGTAYYRAPARLQATVFELAKPKSLNIGYVESGFDHVADALAAAGFHITKLSEMDLAMRDLSEYDTIVIGIRAYLSRSDLKKNHSRILDYVHNGGHLVVQYHKPSDGLDGTVPAPYPFKLGTPSIRWRVADEKAKVTITDPASPLFSYPNQIHQEDWENWVQERGLYFPKEWSDQFQTVLQVSDRNEAPLDSGILLANYGKGTYLYTNLVFYRQIQNQVAGAYRMFTNLLSYGKTRNLKKGNEAAAGKTKRIS